MAVQPAARRRAAAARSNCFSGALGAQTLRSCCTVPAVPFSLKVESHCCGCRPACHSRHLSVRRGCHPRQRDGPTFASCSERREPAPSAAGVHTRSDDHAASFSSIQPLASPSSCASSVKPSPLFTPGNSSLPSLARPSPLRSKTRKPLPAARRLIFPQCRRHRDRNLKRWSSGCAAAAEIDHQRVLLRARRVAEAQAEVALLVVRAIDNCSVKRISRPSAVCTVPLAAICVTSASL